MEYSGSVLKGEKEYSLNGVKRECSFYLIEFWNTGRGQFSWILRAPFPREGAQII